MLCPKCGATDIRLARDVRGLAEAHCAVCDAYIKKMSTGEVIEYYENLLNEYAECADEAAAISAAESDEKEDRGPCRYCTEYFFMRQGRLGTVYIPLEAKYCPMCGRELKESDRAY